jgi:hypothetical protein
VSILLVLALIGPTVRAVRAAGDQNPVNRSTCPQHGPYSGLICTRCITSLPKVHTAAQALPVGWAA